MRIALVHSYYRSDQPSGENIVVDRQAAALRERGHEVTVIARHSDAEQSGRLSPIRTAWQVGIGTGSDPTGELQRFSPDVTHVHNLFPNFATRWLTHWSGPLVATLHNYRTLCANALLFRAGQECTLCPDGHPWAGVRHGCYRDSQVATVPLAWRNHRGPSHDALLQRADRIVVLSQRSLAIYGRYGAPRERLRLIPNGVPDGAAHSPSAAEEDSPSIRQATTGWVWSGRLTPEKGLLELMAMWPADERLDLYGAGPLEDAVRTRARGSIRFHGAITSDELRRRLPSSLGCLQPGTNPEGAYPLTAVEALAAGIPLVAARGGAAADMIAEWGCGATYHDQPSLIAALESVTNNKARQAARRTFEEHFQLDRWLDALEGVYAEAGAT